MKIQKIIKIDLNKSAFAYPVRVVQYDTGVQLVLTLTDFEIPDGTTAIVYFMKPSGKFVYQEDNISISGNTITVDVHNQAFTEYGKVKYQVELTNGSDIVTTFSRMVEVERSLSNSGGEKSATVIRAFEELTAEKIAEIETSTLEFVESAKQNILDSIPEDYTEMSNKVDYLYNNVANAIKGNVSGSVIAVDDVSPVEHEMFVKVISKNLIVPFTDDKVVDRDGVTQSVTAGGNTIRITGTSGSVAGGRNSFASVSKPFILEKGKTYTLSHELVKGTMNGTYSVYVSTIGDYEVITNCSSAIKSKTFIAEKTSECFIGVNVSVGTTYNDIEVRFQIEEGDIATNYTTYVDPTTTNVKKCGKNLIPYPFASKTQVYNGITFTDNGDGSVSIEGTATGDGISFMLVNTGAGSRDWLPAGTYFLSCPEIANLKDIYLSLFYYDDNESTTYVGTSGKNQKFTFEKTQYYGLYFRVYGGVTIDKITVYPQIEVGEVATNFESPLTIESVSPNEDGTVEFTSVSPNMTILSDTKNTVVDCEYIKDSNVVINKLINAIVALGGSV